MPFNIVTWLQRFLSRNPNRLHDARPRRRKGRGHSGSVAALVYVERLENRTLLSGTGMLPAVPTDLAIGGFFYAQGNFSSTDQGQKTVNLSDGKTAIVNLTTTGVEGASAFVGNHGPATNASAQGFSLTGVNFVVAKLTEVGGAKRTWQAVYANATAASLVGIDAFSMASIDNIVLKMNSAAADGSVVDFSTSQLDTSDDSQLMISTGTGSLAIDYSTKLTDFTGNVSLAVDE